MIKFSPDCLSLFCFRVTGRTFLKSYRLNVSVAEHPSGTPSVFSSSLSLSDWKLRSTRGAASVLGNSPPLFDLAFDFVLDTLTVLRGYPNRSVLDMLNISELRSLIPWKTRSGIVTPPFRPLRHTQTTGTIRRRSSAPLGMTRNVAFSSTGETVYVIRTDARNSTAMPWDVSRERKLTATCTAWDVSSEEPVGQVGIFSNSCLEAHMKEGVLLSTANGCLEMWSFKLSNCIRRWPDLVQPMEITQIVPISEKRVALSAKNKVIILNTTTSEIVSIPIDQGDFVTCNSKCQLLTRSSESFQLLDGQTTLWKTDLRHSTLFGTFSLSERFIVICAKTQEGHQGVYVLDVFSGEILHILCKGDWFSVDCQFVSDEECVINSRAASEGSSLRLFNVESGELLSLIDLERQVFHLAVCPCERLLAIDQSDSKLGVELIHVHLPRHKDSRKNKR